MNGHFEIDNSAYPIGWLNAGEAGKYRLTDMTSLKNVGLREYTIEEVKELAKQANRNIRANPGITYAQAVSEVL